MRLLSGFGRTGLASVQRGSASSRWLRVPAALHRWLGIGLCVPFLIWFVSGIVLSFAGFPAISPGERLARSRPLDPERLRIPVAEAALEAGFSPDEVRLEMFGLEPVWRFESASGFAAVNAETGAQLIPLDEATALAAAVAFAGQPLPGARAQRLDAPDQWTPRSERNGQLPLLHVTLADGAGTEIYVSLARAELVQRTTWRSRLAACGATPHWWYPVALRRHGAVWRTVVLIGSGLGTVSCLFGLCLGIVYLRRRGDRSGARRWSPYADSWLRWHHLIGLAVSGLTLSWVFSGMLSLNPGRWSSGSQPQAREIAQLRGAPLELSGLRVSAGDAVERCSREVVVKALELTALGGRPYWLCESRWNESRLLDGTAPDGPLLSALGLDVVLATLEAKFSSQLLASSSLAEPDSYVYPTYREPEIHFPLVRLDFTGGVSWYVDPHSLRLLASLDRTSRLERWLHQGLHCLDFAPLYRVRWLWQSVVVVLCLAGAAFSVTGIAVAAGWVRRCAAASARKEKSIHLDAG